MNPLPALNEAFCIRLAETLLHFLWQGTFIALGAFGTSLLLRRAAARARYGVCVAALALMAASPAATFWLLAPARGVLPASAQARPAPFTLAARPRTVGLIGERVNIRPLLGDFKPSPDHQTISAEPAAPPLPRPAASGWHAWAQRLDWPRLAPAVVVLYLIGVLLMLGRLLLALRGGNALRRRARAVQEPALLDSLARAAAALRLRTAPALAWCGEVAVPTVVGILKPTILLPLSLSSGLAPEQVELLLLHELAHLRRLDHWLNMAQWLVETVLFFHPAVWFVSRRIRIERELSCDDMVLATGAERDAYADSLLRMAEISRALDRLEPNTALALGAATRRSKLSQRILRLIEGEAHEAVRIGRAWPLGVLALVLALALLASRLEVMAGRATKEKTGADPQTNALIEQVREGLKKQNFRNLYLEAKMRFEDWNTTSGQYEPNEIFIATRSWYENLAHGRKRIEFDPEQGKWVGGPTPIVEDRYLIAETNNRFFKIDHVLDPALKQFTSHLSEEKPKRNVLVKAASDLAWRAMHKGQEMPKGISAALFQDKSMVTGVGLLPDGAIAEGTMARLMEALEALRKRPDISVKAREVTENGQRLVQIEFSNARISEVYRLDPEKGYALAYADHQSFDIQTKVPRIMDRLQVKNYRQVPGGGWVPTAWTKEITGHVRESYQAEFIGTFDPKTADAIFEAKDVTLNKPMPSAPRGPRPASGVTISKNTTDEKVNPNENSRAAAAWQIWTLGYDTLTSRVAAIQILPLGYDPLTSRGATQALNKAYDPSTTEPATKSVRIVASKDRLAFQGREVPFFQLPELLRAVPDRSHTVLEIAETTESFNLSNWGGSNIYYYTIANQAPRLTSVLGFHHYDLTVCDLETLGSARYEGPITTGRDMPLKTMTGTVDAPELLRTEWLRIEQGRNSLKARLHGTILSSPHTCWMVTLELFDERDVRRVRVFATLENSGKLFGVASRDDFDWDLPTDSASETEYLHEGFDRSHRLPFTEERQRTLASAGRLVRCKLIITQTGLPFDFGHGRAFKPTLKVPSKQGADQTTTSAAAIPVRSDARTSATKTRNTSDTRTIELPVHDQSGKPVAGAAMQALTLGYDPFTSRSATQALNKAYDPITTQPATKSVRIVASRDRLTFQGREVPLSQLPELLRAVPDRIHTVLEMAETMDVGVSSNIRDYSFYSMAHNQALRLTRELGFHHCEPTIGELGTLGSARCESEFTPGRELPVKAMTGTLDAPELIQTEWLRIDPGKETLKARLHGTILSSPNTRWMATLELFDERGVRRVLTIATLENNGKRAGGVTRDAFDLDFPTDSASSTHYYHDGYDASLRLPLNLERQRVLGSTLRLVRCKLMIHEIGLPIDFGGGRVVKSTLKVTSQTAPAWRKRFDAVYRLGDKEALKHIAPPFIPERLQYYADNDQSQAKAVPEGPDMMTFTWEGMLKRRMMGFGKGYPLKHLLHDVIGLTGPEYECPGDLLTLDMPGDWITHKDADTESLLMDLAKILKDDFGRTVRIEKQRSEREALVATGRFYNRPLNGNLNIYVEKLDTTSGGGAGAGNIDRFLKELGDVLGMPVVNKTYFSNINDLFWHKHFDIRDPKLRQNPAMIAKVLDNITSQTDLQFHHERQMVEVWSIREDSGTSQTAGGANTQSASSSSVATATTSTAKESTRTSTLPVRDQDGKQQVVSESIIDTTGAAARQSTDPLSNPDEISGTVIDEQGKPIEGVLVDAWTWYPGNETKTDKSGNFRLTKSDANHGKVELRFTREGYCPLLIAQQPTGALTQSVILGNRTWFEGELTDNDAKPVPDALVRANQGPVQGPGVNIDTVWTETRSDRNGRYKLLVQEGRYDIEVQASGGRVGRLNGIAIKKNEAKQLDIPVLQGITFQARVLDSVTSQPIAGVRLFNYERKGLEGRSDAGGNLRIEGLPPGKMEFSVEAKGYTRWWSAACASEWNRWKIDDSRSGWQRNFDYLDFDIKESMALVTIILERGVRITGRILDPDGNPVAGATAAPAKTGSGHSLTGDTRFSVKSKADGTFEMLLPASHAAQYNLVAHDGGYNQWRAWANGVLPPIKTKPGDEIKGVELRLTRPGTVRGKVVDAAGKPVAGREVRASAADRLENRYYAPAAKTDQEGRFELKFVRPGGQYIQVAPYWLDAKEAPKGTSQTVEVQAGQTAEGVQLEAQGEDQ